MKHLLMYIFILALTVPGIAQRVQKTTHLNLDASSLTEFEVEAISGFLKIQGSAEANEIDVQADIDLKGVKEKNLDSVLQLELTQRENRGRLIVKLKQDTNGFWKNNNMQGVIDLTVTVPAHLVLSVNDGSGFITINNFTNAATVNDGSGDILVSNIAGKLTLNDGSGDITLREMGSHVTLSDGSGNIDALQIDGDLDINDGSGDIEVVQLNGNLSLNDGSGDIRLQQLAQNVHINDGSGEINITDVQGSVTISDGSGSIIVDKVGGNVTINGSGSGSTQFTNISGNLVVH